MQRSRDRPGRLRMVLSLGEDLVYDRQHMSPAPFLDSPPVLRDVSIVTPCAGRTTACDVAPPVSR